jgi:tetratricopeptide (TPR) repeat protein
MNGQDWGRSGKWQVVVWACVISAGIVSLAYWRSRAPSQSAGAYDLLHEARLALYRKNFALAERLASRIERHDSRWAPGRLVAGEAATRSGRRAEAMNYYRDVPRDGTPTAVLAAFALGELLRDNGELTAAEREYAWVLDREPGHALARSRLAFLLGATGRRWESLPHLTFLLRSDAASLEQLVLLADLERPMEQGEFLRKCARTAPDDMLVQLGLAADALDEGNSLQSRRSLQNVVDRAPQLVAAQAMLGELLVDAGDEAMLRWNAGLPPTAEEYPEVWLVRGLWARRRGELRIAARCFWEAVRIAPHHRRANYHLGQVLIALGESSGAEFAERAAALFELTATLDRVLLTQGRDEPTMRRAVELLEASGRLWEACGWAAKANAFFPSASWPAGTFARLSASLTKDTPQTIASANLALQCDLSRYPGLTELVRPRDRRLTPDAVVKVRSSIRFEDRAEAAGIDFAYFNSHDSATKGARMFEQTGGGVAVLDFDRDGWPDLLFTQGLEWKSGARAPNASGKFSDCLYRNIRGEAFGEVTRLARLADADFGQGCAAGDFDNDGFADLYVANIGRNRLHHNNGDGTFADVTDQWSREEETWTASCVMVDLNADGLPDLFDVTYVTGPGVYEKICDGHGCSPKVFAGLPDRLYLNQGDGTFEFVPEALPELNDSKGLGVVTVPLFDPRRPCLFIANDQVPNFLLRNDPSADRWKLRLVETAFTSGLAYNVDGLAMASMGIAADDANGDGRVDFFVSTFYDEPRTLFLQEVTQIFVDGTNAAGLRGPGLPFVGWGTQFLDADRDGAPDLVVANGHVDDYRDQGGEYHMRPQFFRNTGGGRFVELKSPDIGPWFARKYLGRGLARVDWNRDGRMDFAVSNIGERAALVTNVTVGAGHYLNVRLNARHTARDAIGTVVEVEAGGRHFRKQLAAGDGYMASNERLLQFGLGEADEIDELRVLWPSGAATVIKAPPVDVTVELVEDSTRGVLWRGADPASFEFAEECLSRGN